MAPRSASLAALLALLSLHFLAAAGEASGVYTVVMAGNPTLVQAQVAGLRGAAQKASHSAALRLRQTQTIDAVLKFRSKVLYHYTNVLNGFSAVLTPSEVEALRKSKGVLSVSRAKTYHRTTTQTGAFLGLDSVKPTLYGQPFGSADTYKGSFWNTTKAGKGIVIGMLDSGIWPESPSFSPKGMPPPPKKWKGICQVGQQWPASTCNNKIIGARYYYKAFEAGLALVEPGFKVDDNGNYLSARDVHGHGSHTSGIAAGSLVTNVPIGFPPSSSGLTAKGMAYNAHIAVYKVCWEGSLKNLSNSDGCSDGDLLAALEDAVSDGVDVVSLSLGAYIGGLLDDGTLEVTGGFDSFAYGTLNAALADVFVSVAAGNSGPNVFTTANVWPWQTSVAATSVDRSFANTVALGGAGGGVFSGASLTRGIITAPIVFAGAVGLANATVEDATRCFEGTLDPKLVKGKIVLCKRGVIDRVAKGRNVKSAGGVGMVLYNGAPTQDLVADYHFLPTSHITADDGAKVQNYLKSTKAPSATITGFKVALGVPQSPSIAGFSSVGPSVYDPTLQKPDISAPGLSIVSAWTQSRNNINLAGSSVGPSSPYPDGSPAAFNIISGTSMACPHISGIAAAIKAVHPTWSESWIRSALMTTAVTTDNTKKIISYSDGTEGNPLSFGSGFVNARAALDPGLVYDVKKQSYLAYLCALGVFPKVLCPVGNFAVAKALNYPSITIVRRAGYSYHTIVKRTLTKVGEGVEDYYPTVSGFTNLRVLVRPKRLRFSWPGQEATFNVTIIPKGRVTDGYSWGRIVWASKTHSVAIPVQYIEKFWTV